MTICALLLSSCTVGPSRRTDLATSGSPAPTAATISATPPPTGPGGPGRTADPIRWTTCPPSVPDSTADGIHVTLDCGGVVVPVSYTDPNQRSFAIRLARARTTPDPDAPPLVVLYGDPGQNGRAAVATIAAGLPGEIRDHYAIITMDLRGTGRSGGIDCVSDSTERAIVGLAADPTTPQGAEQLASIARQLTFDCGDLVGPNLSQFNTTNAADDLDAVRAALGTPTISVLARGYGATIGAVYAHRYPGRVARMVLDAPTDPLAPPDQRAALSAKAAAAVLQDFAAACPGFDAGCPLGGDPIGAISDLVNALSVSGNTAGPWAITGGSVLLALLTLLPDQQSWPALATAIAQLRDGAAQPLADLLVGALGGERLSEQLTGGLIYRCNDTAERLIQPMVASAVTAARTDSPLFGPFTVTLAALCSSWPASDAPVGRVTATGAPPIVVVGSVSNPVHPYAGVQSVAGQLASGVLISWQSAADSAYPASACVTRTVDAYLLGGAVPPRGLLCPP